MEEEIRTNFVLLKGTAMASPAFSHESHGVDFYTFPIAVARLSGAEDTINVLVREELLQRTPVIKSDFLSVSGQLRSYNNKSGSGSRLVITVLAADLEYDDGSCENTVLLKGVLCKPPIYRQTPLGREICDMMLAVNRHYGRADYIPCIAWGENARFCGELEVGARLEITGRIQSRRYIKVSGSESVEKTAFEVSALGVSTVWDT